MAQPPPVHAPAPVPAPTLAPTTAPTPPRLPPPQTPPPTLVDTLVDTLSLSNRDIGGTIATAGAVAIQSTRHSKHGSADAGNALSGSPLDGTTIALLTERVAEQLRVVDARFQNTTVGGQPFASNSRLTAETFGFLVLTELVIFMCYATVAFCTSHACSCMLCNCYNPMRCHGNATWMHKLASVLRGGLWYAFLIGLVVMISADDCERLPYRAVCVLMSPFAIWACPLIWLVIGIFVYTVQESLHEDSCCTTNGMQINIDQRMERVRMRSTVASSSVIAKRFAEVNGGMVSRLDDREEGSDRDESEDDTTYGSGVSTMAVKHTTAIAMTAFEGARVARADGTHDDKGALDTEPGGDAGAAGREAENAESAYAPYEKPAPPSHDGRAAPGNATASDEAGHQIV